MSLKVIPYGIVGLTLTSLLAMLIASLLIEKWGRRNLLLLGTALQATALLGSLIVGYLFPSVRGISSATGMCVFSAGYNFGLGPLTWTYLGEIFPLEIRASALAWCGVVNWTCSIIVVFAGRLMTSDFCFLFFGLVCAAGFAAFFIWVLETSGSNPDDSPVSPRAWRTRSRLLHSTGDAAL